MVREFTKASGFKIPKTPQLMNKQEVIFITKMVIDELLELYATVGTPDEAKNVMKDIISEAKEVPYTEYKGGDEVCAIAEQADAFVDILYYVHNAAVKKGLNLSSIFEIVHNANMEKRSPVTGLFMKNEEGKIIKPLGWEAPDVVSEINKQITEQDIKEIQFGKYDLIDQNGLMSQYGYEPRNIKEFKDIFNYIITRDPKSNTDTYSVIDYKLNPNIYVREHRKMNVIHNPDY